MAAYGAGGFGLYFAVAVSGSISLAAGNTLIGNTIGITPVDLQWMNIISTIIGFGLVTLRGFIIDNTRNKMGKFRPYIKFMGLPTVLFSLLLVWLPYEHMVYWQKFVSVLIIFQLIQFTHPFFFESYHNLARVMSSDTQERTLVVAVSTIIWSWSPTISNMFIPIIVDAAKFNGMTDIRTYRYIYPAFCLAGIFLTRFAYRGTRERIVVGRSHYAQVGLWDSIKAIAKSKNFWVSSVAGWIGFLEGATAVLFLWSFEYGRIGSMSMYGVMTLILGSSALIPLWTTPLLTKYLGKRAIIIGTNALNIFFLAALLLCYQNFFWLMFFLFVNKAAMTYFDTVSPSMNADIRDEQQYLSGKRLDGMFSIGVILGSVIGMGTGMVIPQLYRLRGLVDDYNVLYDTAIRNGLFEILIVASTIGAVMNLIPFFFYDLTEDKQRGMIRALKIRAMFEDYGNKVLQDDVLVEGVAIIKQAKADYAATGGKPLDAAGLASLKKIRRMKVFRGGRAERKTRYEARLREEDKWNAHYVIDELEKFSRGDVLFSLKLARELCEGGLAGLYRFEGAARGPGREAAAMPGGGTKTERNIRRLAMNHYRERRRAAKAINRFYPGGTVTEFDYAALEELYELPEETGAQLREKNRLIKTANRERGRFYRSAKPYIEARELLNQARNYGHLEDIYAAYEEARGKSSGGSAGDPGARG
jgi:GPH family glycoside/pentoside/hexuronide:cation symporter